MLNVKATGIIRKIDELGRIVIPKELRRTLRIREGDPLEIYTDRDGEVIFRKYSLLGGIGDFAAQICDAIYQTTGLATLVTDRDNVLAVAGASRREYGAQPVSGAG
jgi:AbrB family transcriptional regulator (stage V sporulation protein T)